MADGDGRRYLENWQDEVDSAATYRAMADGEDDARLAGLYRRLAETEERHAAFWEEQLRGAGMRVPDRRPGWRARVLAWTARRFGARHVLPTVAAAEHADQRMYDRQPETDGTGLQVDERSHARLLSTLAAPTGTGMPGGSGLPGPGGLPGGVIARLEGRHRAVGGNTLRAAVLGANDGLVSNLSLVSGVAGAGLAQGSIVVAGLAGLLAGAGSMAMGEWVSVQSAKEQSERQLQIEGDELDTVPDEEAEELRLIYQAKGLPPDQARAVVERLMADRDTALSALATEELGLDPDDLGGSPWTAAGASFLLFAVGALVPLVPFLVLAGTAAVVASVAASALGLLALGAAITLFTGRSAWRSGLRQVAIGLGAAGLTYGVGALVGVSLAGA